MDDARADGDTLVMMDPANVFGTGRRQRTKNSDAAEHSGAVSVSEDVE